jgi:hypothetical protein
MSETNKTVLLEANAAISKLDFEGFLKFCTDDVKWTMVGEQTIEGNQYSAFAKSPSSMCRIP